MQPKLIFTNTITTECLQYNILFWWIVLKWNCIVLYNYKNIFYEGFLNNDWIFFKSYFITFEIKKIQHYSQMPAYTNYILTWFHLKCSVRICSNRKNNGCRRKICMYFGKSSVNISCVSEIVYFYSVRFYY